MKNDVYFVWLKKLMFKLLFFEKKCHITCDKWIFFSSKV